MKFSQNLNYFAIFCLIFIAGTFFMPFYEGWLSHFHTISESTFWVVRINHSGDQEFDTVVYNGFRSMYAFVNLILSVVLVVGIYHYPRSLTAAIVSTVLMLVCLFLVYVGCSAGFGAPFGDTMKYGFYLFVTGEVLLIVTSFVKFAVSRKLPKEESGDLLDQS